ncbi:response regulator transcription factor [Taibaiella chishuiensis]|uniref:LuxR family two component transcriptional regulator n=1 Tax=Taibaiella chishuiensis TaxID=1434707 RepID=A0A2P8D2X8_9BACT|nr:response regulator transcription factor [Taibaiella chishuiensis]PSK91588.1 LuxR family two component transcriptional regulator [Taibaiella chishuiensis]
MRINSNLNIAVVDDHQIIIDGIRLLLRDKVNIVLEAHNGLDFCKKLKHLKPDEQLDLVLLDVGMPIMDGFETLDWIKKNYPSLKVIILTMHNSTESVLRMIELGADGYMLKSTNKVELLNALNGVINLGSYYPNWVSEILAKQFRKNTPTLNEREIEYIKLAASDLTSKEIASKMGVGVRTVEGVKSFILSKLNIRTSSGLIAYAIRNNLINF